MKSVATSAVTEGEATIEHCPQEFKRKDNPAIAVKLGMTAKGPKPPAACAARISYCALIHRHRDR